MLVLKRRLGERVCIGDSVVVEIVELSSRNGIPFVGLGFTAPPDVRVDRSEVRDRREQEAKA